MFLQFGACVNQSSHVILLNHSTCYFTIIINLYILLGSRYINENETLCLKFTKDGSAFTIQVTNNTTY